VDRVSVPDQPLAVAVGRVEDGLELLDALFGAAEAENALNLGRFAGRQYSWYYDGGWGLGR